MQFVEDCRFGALNRPRDMESPSKVYNFQEEIQCHKVMAVIQRKKNPKPNCYQSKPREKNACIVTVGIRIWALIDNKLNTLQCNLLKFKDWARFLMFLLLLIQDYLKFFPIGV